VALPLEIADFFALLREVWYTFPLMVRQVFYLSLACMGFLGVMKAIR